MNSKLTRSLPKAAAVLATLAMVGCASTSNVRTASVDSAADSKREGKFVINVERVAHVEAVARANGTQVHWVNLPRKRVD